MFRRKSILVRAFVITLMSVLAPANVSANSAAASMSGSLHGSTSAIINDHGQLVLALDEFDAKINGGNGLADYVFIFAPKDEEMLERLNELVERINDHDGQVNLELSNAADRTVLRLHVPLTLNVFLTVRKASSPVERSPESADPDVRRVGEDDERKVPGLALSRVNVKADGHALDEAIAEYSSFNVVPDSK